MKSFLFIALLFSHHLWAQDDTAWQLLRRVPAEVAYATTDHLDNLYLVTSTGQIKKTDANGDSVAVYSQQKNYGDLTSLDVSNPLKLVLFYKDFSTVVLLDRWLSVKSTLDLRRSGILQPSAAALSYDNKLWVFDGWDNKLKKVDEQGRVLLETPDLRNSFSSSILPQQIISEEGLVYLVDSAQGIFVFDHYGTYKRNFPLPQNGSVAVRNNWLLYTEPQALLFSDPKTFREKRLPFPAFFSNYSHMQTSANRLVLWSDSEVVVYRIRY